MAAGVVMTEDSLDSLGQEEVFLAETATFAKCVIGIHYNLKQSDKLRSQGLAATTTKGLSQSRVQSSVVVPSSSSASEPVSEEAALFAEKLSQIAEKYDQVLKDQYDRFFRDHTTWDITYDVFKRGCTGVLRATAHALANRSEQILLVFANGSYIYEELKNAGGGDTHRQNEFINHVGRYLVQHGFQPWIREQGGWDKLIGSNVDVTAALIDLPEDTPV